VGLSICGVVAVAGDLVSVSHSNSIPYGDRRRLFREEAVEIAGQ
jgi:hypothetical protein